MRKKSIRKLFVSALFVSLFVPSAAQAADPLTPGQVVITRVVQSVGSISVYWEITGPGAAATALEYEITNFVTSATTTADAPSLVSPLVITKDPLNTNLASTLYTVVLRGKNGAGSGPDSAPIRVVPN